MNPQQPKNNHNTPVEVASIEDDSEDEQHFFSVPSDSQDGLEDEVTMLIVDNDHQPVEPQCSGHDHKAPCQLSFNTTHANGEWINELADAEFFFACTADLKLEILQGIQSLAIHATSHEHPSSPADQRCQHMKSLAQGLLQGDQNHNQCRHFLN